MGDTNAEFLSRKQCADLLTRHGFPATPKWLQNKAVHQNEGRGPPFIRYRTGNGQRPVVVYEREKVLAWLAERREDVD